MKLAPLLLTLALGASLARVAAAKDPKAEFSVDVTLENAVDPGTKAKIAKVGLKGRTGPLAEGTMLVATVRTKGGARAVSCAMFRVVVSGNKFEGGFVWPGKEFAPLTYDVRFELQVGKQSEPVKKWLMREYGYNDDFIDVIGTKEAAFGTVEERAKFGQENVKTILKLVNDLEALREKVGEFVAVPRADRPDWDQAVKAQAQQLLTWRNAFDDYRFRWVALTEDGLLNGTLNVLKGLARALDYHSKGRSVAALVNQSEQRLKSLRATLVARLPLQHPEDEKKDGKKGEKDGKQDEKHKEGS